MKITLSSLEIKEIIEKYVGDLLLDGGYEFEKLTARWVGYDLICVTGTGEEDE